MPISTAPRERTWMGIAKTHSRRPYEKTVPYSSDLHTISPYASSAYQAIRPKRYALIAIVFLAGCAVLDTHQAKLDQKQLRDVLMDYTQDQILDNLIRAYNGLPIVHFDFARISAGVTSKIVPAVGGGRVATDVQTRTPTHTTVKTNEIGQTGMDSVVKTVAAVGGIVETVARPFNYAVAAERDNVISLDVKPVLDDRNVYAAYINFLNAGVKKSAISKGTAPPNKITTKITTPTTETTTTSTSAEGTKSTKEIDETMSETTEATPSKPQPNDLAVSCFSCIKSLQHRPTRPTAQDKVLVGPKLWKNEYYWVSEDYKSQFFELCLATVARGKPAASSGAEEVTNQLEDFQSQQQQQFLQSR